MIKFTVLLLSVLLVFLVFSPVVAVAQTTASPEELEAAKDLTNEADADIKAGRYDEALNKLAKVKTLLHIENLKGRPLDLYNKAKAGKKSQEIRAQKQQLEENYQQYKTSGDEAFGQGNYEAAISEYEQALEYKNNDITVLRKIAEARKQMAQAEASGYKAKAQSEESKYNFYEAIGLYKKAYESNPEWQIEQKIKELEKRVEDYRNYKKEGNAFAEKQYWDKALEQYMLAEKKWPNRADIDKGVKNVSYRKYEAAGDKNMTESRFDDAIKNYDLAREYEKTASIAEKLKKAWYSKYISEAKQAYEGGNYSSAISLISKAEEYAVLEADAQLLRKNVLDKMEEKFWSDVSANNGIENYESYLRRYPEGKYSKKARNLIITLSIREAKESILLHRYRLADDHLKRARQYSPYGESSEMKKLARKKKRWADVSSVNSLAMALPLGFGTTKVEDYSRYSFAYNTNSGRKVDEGFDARAGSATEFLQPVSLAFTLSGVKRISKIPPFTLDLNFSLDVSQNVDLKMTYQNFKIKKPGDSFGGATITKVDTVTEPGRNSYAYTIAAVRPGITVLRGFSLYVAVYCSKFTYHPYKSCPTCGDGSGITFTKIAPGIGFSYTYRLSGYAFKIGAENLNKVFQNDQNDYSALSGEDVHGSGLISVNPYSRLFYFECRKTINGNFDLKLNYQNTMIRGNYRFNLSERLLSFNRKFLTLGMQYNF